jgi:hypothetical protein
VRLESHPHGFVLGAADEAAGGLTHDAPSLANVTPRGVGRARQRPNRDTEECGE